MKGFIVKEIETLRGRPFNVWLVDGGYRFLSMKTHVGMASISQLENNAIDIALDYWLLKKMKTIYDICNKSILDNFSLLNYTNHKQANINALDLITLLESNLNLFNTHELEFDNRYKNIN
jgi:hypothetical protein